MEVPIIDIIDTNIPSDTQRLKVKWKPAAKNLYQTAIDSNEETERVKQDIAKIDPHSVTQSGMDEVYTRVNDILMDAASEANMVTVARKRQRKRTTKSASKPWFDSECEKRRDQYMSTKNRLKRRRVFPCIGNSKSPQPAKETRNYNSFIRKKSNQYYKRFHRKIRGAKQPDPKKYWRLISSANHQPSQKQVPTLSQLEDHFAALSDVPVDQPHTDFDNTKIQPTSGEPNLGPN